MSTSRTPARPPARLRRRRDATPRDATPRGALADAFGLEAYDDAAGMLAADVVHVAMSPAVRVSVVEAVADAGVPACTVEKPIALGVEDWRAIRALDAASDTEFAVRPVPVGPRPPAVSRGGRGRRPRGADLPRVFRAAGAHRSRNPLSPLRERAER